jgi:hypothetical protein
VVPKSMARFSRRPPVIAENGLTVVDVSRYT